MSARAAAAPLIAALAVLSPATAHAASLAVTLKGVTLPQVVSTDALDRTLPAVVVQKNGAVGLFASSAEDAAALVAPKVGAAAAVQGKLAQLLKKEGSSSAALFVDVEAPGGAIAQALAAADRAGASSYSLVVHGQRAVRAPRPPGCERSDPLAERCAEVRFALDAAGIIASAADLDVGVEGCEPRSASVTRRPGPRAAWDGKPLLAEDGTCPSAPDTAPTLLRAITARLGDCARARVVVEHGVSGGQVIALVKALRAAGVDAVTVVAGSGKSARATTCAGAAPLAVLDVGLPVAKQPAAPPSPAPPPSPR